MLHQRKLDGGPAAARPGALRAVAAELAAAAAAAVPDGAAALTPELALSLVLSCCKLRVRTPGLGAVCDRAAKVSSERLAASPAVPRDIVRGMAALRLLHAPLLGLFSKAHPYKS
ncbi:hypothetical protein DIPPA_28695 [Diplonema papillatum]|nr:hypothetical protein DIPPA_28695 [Diplonema papillatum]